MKWHWLNNPKNTWGRWVNSQFWQKLLFTLVVILLTAGSLCFETYRLLNKRDALTRLIQQQQDEIGHQQRLLASLKQQTPHNLSPELAKKLPEINQQVVKLSSEISLENSQWALQTEPILTLEIQGNFSKLREFLTALLQMPSLKLVSWQITQLDPDERDNTQSIYSQLIFQLQKD